MIRWDDLLLGQPAITLLSLLEESVTAGQRQLFLRPGDYAKLGNDAVDAVMTLLRDE